MSYNEKISGEIMDQKFYHRLLLTGLNFLNSFLAVVFQPRQFFSKTEFSEHKWHEDAISYFIISYAMFYGIFILYTRKALEMVKQKAPNLAIIDTDKFFQGLGEYTGFFIEILHFIFVINLSLYLIFWIFRQKVSIYKIINILSYIVGTSMILLTLTFKTMLPAYLIWIFKIHPSPFELRTTILLFVILLYIVSLLIIGNKYAVMLSWKKAVKVSILLLIIAPILSYII